MRERDFPEALILVIAVLVDFPAVHAKQNIARFDAGRVGWRAREDFGDISPAGSLGEIGEAAQLRIARVGKSETGPREAGVRLLGCGAQELGNDRSGNEFGRLRGGAVAHDEADETSVLQCGDGETVFAGLERHAQLEDEESVFVDRVGPDFDRGHGGRSGDRSAVRFELHHLDAIADRDRFVEARTGNALQEIRGGRGEKGEVRVIVDHFHLCRGFEGGVRFLQFHVDVVRYQFGRHEDAAVHEHNAETLSYGARVFAPRLHEVGRLRGDVNADHGRLLAFARARGLGGWCGRRCGDRSSWSSAIGCRGLWCRYRRRRGRSHGIEDSAHTLHGMRGRQPAQGEGQNKTEEKSGHGTIRDFAGWSRRSAGGFAPRLRAARRGREQWGVLRPAVRPRGTDLPRRRLRRHPAACAPSCR